VLDVEAPAFRGGSLAGAMLAGLLLAGIAYLVISRERAHSSAHRARTERDEALAPPASQDEGEG